VSETHTSTSKHGYNSIRNKRQIDRNPISRLHADAPKESGTLLNPLVELLISPLDDLGLPILLERFSFPEERGMFTRGFQMTIETVH
jgi:hypothetical protein